MSKVTREVAEKEVNDWLDYKKVGSQKRESNKDQIDVLIDAICEGALVLKADTKEFVHTLKFATEGEQPITELTYKPRLSYSQVKGHLHNVKPSDADGRFIAYMAALTGKPKLVFEKLDSVDLSIAQSITLFFV